MEQRYFQYLAGERRGEVLVFDKIEQEDEMVFVSFKDGARCNEDLILPINEKDAGDMLMAEVENHRNIWKFKEEWIGREEEVWDTNKNSEKVCVQPFREGKKVVTATPPRKAKAKFGLVNTYEETAPAQLPKPDHSNDPVWVMMEKARKFDTEIPMILTILLPAKSLYNVTKESFEEGGEKIIEYIISNIDDTKLKESLKLALLMAYEGNELEVIEKAIPGPLPQ